MSTGHRGVVLAGLFTCVLAGFAFAEQKFIISGQPPATPKQPPRPKPLPAAEPPTKGLPTGAVARLGQTCLRHADRVRAVAFAPDGKTVYTGGDDGTIRVWSVATGEQVNLLQKPGLGVSSLRFTHGGKRLAVQFGSESVIHLLEPSTLKELGTLPFVNRNRLDFSTDGAYLATTDFAGNLTITETANDLPKLELPNANVFDFHPNSKAIAIGDTKGNVTVHLVTGGKPVFTVKHPGTITGIVYSPDGQRLAVGWHAPSETQMETIRVYEPGKEKPVAVIEGFNLPRAWLDSDLLVCRGGSEAGVYDLAKQQWASRLKGVSGEFAVSTDGTKLADTGTGTRVRLWDLKSGKQLHAENDNFPEPTLLVGAPDGRSLFLLTTDTAYLWRIGDARAEAAGKLPGHAVAAAVSGDKLLVATSDAVVLYGNFDPTKPLPAKPSYTFKQSAGAKAVALSAGGNRVAWTVDGGKITVTNTADDAARLELPVTTTTVLALGFNPAGDRLGVLGRDPFFRMWDIGGDEAKEMGKARIQRGQKGVVAFSPDGRLVTAVSTTQLLVFDAGDGKDGSDLREPLMRFERYTDNGPVQHAAFSPDGRLLIVGSAGMYGRVEVWEVATQSLVRVLRTGYGGTTRLCVFPDGKRAASAGMEEAVTVWDLTFRAGKGAPAAADLQTAFSNLSSYDAAIGYDALKTLAAAGNRTVEHLDKVANEYIVDETKINGLINDLGSKTFSIRESASNKLTALGLRAIPAIRIACRSEDPDIRDNALAVLTKLEVPARSLPKHGLTPDALRMLRVVHVLEEIGTAEATAVLKRIAATTGPYAADAKAALARLKKK